MRVEMEVKDELFEQVWALIGGDPSLTQLVEVVLQPFIEVRLARARFVEISGDHRE